MNQLDQSLDMAFSHVPPGVIEIRLLREAKNRGANRRAAPDRRWFESPEMLIGAVPCLLQESADELRAVLEATATTTASET